MPKILTKLVKKIRQARNKSIPELLRNTKSISKRTLLRIESGKSEFETVREGTLFELARLLKVDALVLTGNLPVPEGVLSDDGHTPTTQPIPKKQEEERFETRLVKLGEKFVIVEFSDTHPTGRVIASDITDEAAGLRLSQGAQIRYKLRELISILIHPDGRDTGLLNVLRPPPDDFPDAYELVEDYWLDYLKELILLTGEFHEAQPQLEKAQSNGISRNIDTPLPGPEVLEESLNSTEEGLAK